MVSTATASAAAILPMDIFIAVRPLLASGTAEGRGWRHTRRGIVGSRRHVGEAVGGEDAAVTATVAISAFLILSLLLVRGTRGGLLLQTGCGGNRFQT
jgi:hypothetical protein